MSDASEMFEQFMSRITEAYDKLSPVLKYDREVKGTMMAMACEEAELVFAVWRATEGVQYKIVKGEDALRECIDTRQPVRIDFAVVPVLDAGDACAAKEAYDIIRAAPEVMQ